MSQRTAAALAAQPFTDLFVFSQGWLGDVPSARTQYGNWTAALARDNGLERMRQRPGFLPLFVASRLRASV